MRIEKEEKKTNSDKFQGLTLSHVTMVYSQVLLTTHSVSNQCLSVTKRHSNKEWLVARVGLAYMTHWQQTESQ